MLWAYATAKKKAREFALPGRPVRNGIWLPAGEALCVRLASQHGLLRAAKTVWLVEVDPDEYARMVENTRQIRGRRLYCGRLENLRLDGLIDYAYLDFFGGVNRDNACWIQNELSPHLDKGATICVTQMLAARNNPIFRQQDGLLRQECGTQLRSDYGVMGIIHQRILMVMHRLFHRWDFDVVVGPDGSLFQYRDSVSTMLLVRMTNFRPRVSPLYPPFEE